METYKLPMRKWYSLEQASEKLTKDTGEKVTPGDIIHYANRGFLELSVYVDFEIIDDECKLEIRNSNLNEDLLDDIFLLDVHCWQGYPKLDFISGELFKARLKDEFSNADFFEKMKSKCEDSEFGFVDCDFLAQELDRAIKRVNNCLINEDFFIDLKTNIEELKGFFAIEFADFKSILIDEEDPIINTKDISFRPSRNENIENGFGFCVDGFDLYNKSVIEMNKKSIFITLEEIENLKTGDMKMRSLDSFESYIEEWKQPTRIINPTKIKQENVVFNSDTLKISTLKTVSKPNLFKLESFNKDLRPANDEKTIEKTVPRMEKSEIKSPAKYAKDYAKNLVIGSCLATRKDYPTAGKNTIVKAVLKKLKEDPTLKGFTFQSKRTYTNILDRMEILFPNEKGKTIKISKVTIVTP